MIVAELLDALDAIALEKLCDKLLDASYEVSTSPNELHSVGKLADALSVIDNPELQTLLDDVSRVVKALSRVIIKCVSTVAANTMKVAKLVALDDQLVPILRLLSAFVSRLRCQELLDGRELLRWLPFVLTACYFVNGAELPGADLMQSVVVAEETLDAAVELTKAGDRGSLVAKYVAQIVALCSQDVNKEERGPLGRLLALTFPLVDDLTDATQLVGARLLRHILRWYSDVLLEVLHTAIVTRKPDTLNVSPPGELKHYDRFMPRLLSDTSLCSDVAVRIVFVRHLRVLVIRQGAPHSLNGIRYLQPLLKVLIAGFESVNVALLVATLESLQATVLGAWPRIASHTEEILVGVLRAVAFCELFNEGAEFTPSSDEKEQILTLCEDVLDLLHQVNAGNSVVSDMLATVGNQSPKLSPFCNAYKRNGRLDSHNRLKLLLKHSKYYNPSKQVPIRRNTDQ
ncbi:Armadillo-type fold [Phytophthora cactorum]|nr:Armadillo-type fold [Phytophthora cactorum]